MELIQKDNKIVHGLWVGNKLSALELLTLYSYTHHGHLFYLWTYDELENELPKGVFIKDANEIIPSKKIFYRKYDDPSCGVGKGSIGSPFSDLFRYLLLYKYGGWWTDMDITLLQPIKITEPYFFRSHDKLLAIGNILKVPKGTELMRNTAEQVMNVCDENTIDWLLPNKILCNNIKSLQLTNYIKNNISNNDIWHETEQMVKERFTIPSNWIFIHWMNEEWRKRKIDKNVFYKNSLLSDLLKQYNVAHKKYSIFFNLLKSFT